jgi:hypothetical protein
MVRHPEISAIQALRSYISFYDAIARYRQAYVLGTFEEVVEDYGKVIGRVNDKFDTQFSCFDHSEDNVRRVFSRINELNRAQHERVLEEKVARPSNVRAELNNKAKAQLQALESQTIATKAQEVYRCFIDGAYERT